MSAAGRKKLALLVAVCSRRERVLPHHLRVASRGNGVGAHIIPSMTADPRISTKPGRNTSGGGVEPCVSGVDRRLYVQWNGNIGATLY